MFPLGGMTKPDVREIARKNGLEHIADKSESYEICFIPDDDYRSFLEFRVPGLKEKLAGGEFRSRDGKVYGTHQGYPFYTIGQRKGLVVAVGHPLYVNGIDPKQNVVYLGTKEELLRRSLKAKSVNPMKYQSLDGLEGITACIRYHDRGSEARLDLVDDQLVVSFVQPVEGVTPGQSVVFYQNDDLVGGAIISE
jgi:tRNA-specific 2-thiouridylase